MRKHHPDISIVIPNYNGKALLQKNLPAVLAAADGYPGVCQVIVVDDASTEAGFESIINQFKTVLCLRHARNKGFAETIHTGVEVTTAELLVFLNSDVAPDVDFLEPLASAFKSPDLFSASPLIVDEEGIPNKSSWNRRVFSGGKLKQLKWDLNQALEWRESAVLPSLYASGASMMVRKSLFLELKGFDSLFAPFYFEDQDLGTRAWRRGWRTVFEPRSRVEHQERGSIASNINTGTIRRVQRRNSLTFEWIHFSGRRLITYRVPYYLKQILGRTVRGDWVYLLGFAQALWRMGGVLKSRGERQKDRYRFESILEKVNLPAGDDHASR